MQAVFQPEHGLRFGASDVVESIHVPVPFKSPAQHAEARPTDISPQQVTLMK
jgi:hypothetical protein